MNNLKSLGGWLRITLPSVYTEALSYYESIMLLCQKMIELGDRLDNISGEIVNTANAYTDQKVESAFAEINSLINDINNQYIKFTDSVNLNITLMQEQIRQQGIFLNQQITAINEDMDLKIAQNNQFIFDQIADDLIDFTVINYFTGEKITIQAMLDYLASLHTENSITYTELAVRNVTYNELRDRAITYTELARSGGTLI